MIDTALANYLDMFPNFTESLQFPLIKNRTTYKQILPTNLNMSGFDKTLLKAPMNLKDFINSYAKKKKFLICKKGMKPQYYILAKNSFPIITSWTSSCLSFQ